MATVDPADGPAPTSGSDARRSGTRSSRVVGRPRGRAARARVALVAAVVLMSTGALAALVTIDAPLPAIIATAVLLGVGLGIALVYVVDRRGRRDADRASPLSAVRAPTGAGRPGPTQSQEDLLEEILHWPPRTD